MATTRTICCSSAILARQCSSKFVKSTGFSAALLSQRSQPIVQPFNARSIIQSRKMSDGAHPHLHRNELFNMTGFTAVVTGGGTGAFGTQAFFGHRS